MEGNQYLDKLQDVFIIQQLDTENMALCEYCKHQPGNYTLICDVLLQMSKGCLQC